jgi:hypothetical protein
MADNLFDRSGPDTEESIAPNPKKSKKHSRASHGDQVPPIPKSVTPQGGLASHQPEMQHDMTRFKVGDEVVHTPVGTGPVHCIVRAVGPKKYQVKTPQSNSCKKLISLDLFSTCKFNSTLVLAISCRKKMKMTSMEHSQEQICTCNQIL